MAQLELYKVKMEVWAPVEITLKVWAENPKQAAKKAQLSNMAGPPKPILSKMKKIKATVFKWMHSNVLHTKIF